MLHCHSTYSDGKATIAEMADAARERGWSYIGITDHSQAAFYAGGLSRERVLAQHDEIDALNATRERRSACSRGSRPTSSPTARSTTATTLLDRFDYVIGSVHSRFAMDGATMTARVLARARRSAPHDPRPPDRAAAARRASRIAIDMDAVLEKAAEVGVAVELNADPHRLDLDWRHCRARSELGVPIEIGPDAHSTARAGLRGDRASASRARAG